MSGISACSDGKAGLRVARGAFAAACLAVFGLVAACGGNASTPRPAAASAGVSSSAVSPAQQAPAESAPPADKTGGFDGAKAYEYTQKLVGFGPRPPDTDAIRRTQQYIEAQLKGFGCPVDTDDFHAGTPVGNLAMKDIVVKIPGQGSGIILLLTHYDTVRVENFVGAEDGGSSTGLMLEMARLLCGKKGSHAVWIAFLDGEEAQLVENGQAQWTAADSDYGSRELAARMSVSGDLKQVKAVILADMVGQYDLRLQREANSAKWLADLVWSTAARLGYKDVFVSSEQGAVDDDHRPFFQRGVPTVDIIDLNGYPAWHTAQDTMDKISPRSLAIVGHVILESVTELQKRR
jgi:glutaminyl-peptide cyclotransferase